jgi:nucleoside-diphosphate-sugar epimerase
LRWGQNVKRVLVTGASGFVGVHTLPVLHARGYEVHAVSRQPPPGGDDETRWHAVDLLDAVAARDLVETVAPTHLMHLAWYVEPGNYWDSPENERWTVASTSLLDAFAATGRRALVAGTCVEYDWARASAPLSETRTPLAPRGAYGAAKDSLRRETERLAGETGLSTAWARLFFLFGPGEDNRRLVGSVASALVAGQPALSSSGRQVRDYLLSGDAADGLVAVLDSPVEGAVNVASGVGVSVRNLVEKVAAAANATELLRIGALPDRPDDPPYIVADTTRLHREVGWRPTRDLDAAVRETVAWWREQRRPAVPRQVGVGSDRFRKPE